jgi:hypothetical protein
MKRMIVFAVQKDNYVSPKGRWMYMVYRAVPDKMSNRRYHDGTACANVLQLDPNFW